jgi:carnitine O-acetyltransferase
LELNLLYGVEGTFENRWMDKWTMIVCEDGKSGLNWEHSMLDGHTMLEFYADVGTDASQNNIQVKQASSSEASEEAEARYQACTMVPMSFTVDEESQSFIKVAVDSARKLSQGVGIKSLDYNGFGANFVKTCKCSPDAFVQVLLIDRNYFKE